MRDTILDVIVIGAGFAGLSTSYYLKKQGLNHIVFERGKIGESWRSQRWDSFRMNSTNKLNVLPGMNDETNNAGGFASAPEFVSSLEHYVSTHRLPVVENSKVISIEKTGDIFDITVSSGNIIKNYSSRQVVIASGIANQIKIPSLAENISKYIKQLHTSEYRNAGQLSAGAVLVIGSAQSGVQIAEDLCAAGRKVYLSTSMVGRIPRWYRGRDIFDWVIDTKMYEIKAEELEDPKMLQVTPPQVSGTGSGKDTVSLQSLSKKGIIICGKMESADEHKVCLQPNAAMHVKFADEFSQKIKKTIDEFITRNQLSAPPPHYDEADMPDAEASCASTLTSLDLYENNINSIIWCTGFNAEFSYIRLPVFDNNGKLIHKDGVTKIPGLYFLGYPWQRSRKSVILFGIIEDAEFIVDKIYNYSKTNPQTKPVIV